MPDYTILLIDYEPRSIAKIQEPLERAGYKVVVATDGFAGIRMFREARPDLVLIEAMLPKKHGFEVCLELKKLPPAEVRPVMIITAVYKGRKYRTQAMHQYGCDRYLEKPISDDDLIAAVQGFLKPSSGAAAAGPPAASKAASTGPASSPPSDRTAGKGTETKSGGTEDAESEISSHLDSILS